MNNNVVMAIAGALQMQAAHVPDLMAAHKALRAIVARVAWCGYSYSSMIMAVASEDAAIAQSLGMRCYVSPPNKMMDVDWCHNRADSPVKMIAGSLDVYFEGESSDAVDIVDGVDHFWHGHEGLLGERVADILDQAHNASRM